MVQLVAAAQAAQDRDGGGEVRLAHVHLLEAPFQGGVLLQVLTVLVQGRCADAAQLSPREHGLEEVARVHRPFHATGPDYGVDLVDEEHDHPGRLGHFIQHRLEPLLELAAVLGPGDQGAHVQAHQTAVLERLGHVAGHDALREPLGDGGLADARFADQHRIVLGAAREDLHGAADLLVPPDHRIELADLGLGRKIPSEALQRALRFFRIANVDTHCGVLLRQHKGQAPCQPRQVPT